MAKMKSIGKYEIISKIAEGGMGAVYKAKHPTLNRYVLLKKLTLRKSSQFIERFKREASIMMDFKHEHIVHVYDHFKEGGSYYIAEEFVDGLSLDQLIKRERYLTNEAAMVILYEVCKGLKHAHDKKVIHRDIKPANILISNRGEVKLVDFGIATSLEEEDGLTRDGMTLGTPSYIPPEQIENAKNVDKRADIYSLGVMLYEMLTGQTPFPGTMSAEAIALIHRGKYTPPQRLNPQITPGLRKIIRKSMQPKRNKRFKDLKSIIKLLGGRIRRKDPAFLRESIRNYLHGKDLSDIYRRKRPWIARLVTVLLFLGLLAAGGYYLYQAGYYYEYFQPHDYGALTISARIDRDYKEPGEVFLQARLYRQQQDKLVYLEEVEFNFRQREKMGQEKSYVLESRTLYLEPGLYRLKLNLEGELYWEHFALDPRILQKEREPDGGPKRIHITHEPTPHLPLAVQYSVLDLASGADLTKAASFYLLRGSRWVPWNPALAKSLQSGTTYQFRFEHSGYYPQHYHLLIHPYQALLRLEAQLIPYPGTLELSADTEGLRLLINGSPYVLTGGLQQEYRKLESLGPEPLSLPLAPGEYLVTVLKSEAVKQSKLITVKSESRVSVSALYEEEEKTLSLKVQE